MPRKLPDLPPEIAAAIAADDVEQLRAVTDRLLDLAGARSRTLIQPERVSRRRARSPRPFSVTVRIDLAHAKPPVWRRVELPSTLHLDELHDVLQLLFGWYDCHLHRFTQGVTVWDRDSEMFLCPVDVEEAEDEGVPTSEVRLDEVLAEPGDRLRYVYDYGDEWTLVLVVEKVGDPVERPRCTDGRGGAPPEDSGGVWDWDGSAGPPFDPLALDDELAGWVSDRSLPPEVAELCRRVLGTPAEQVLQVLLDGAELDTGVDTVDEAEAAEMTRGYAWLLSRVGSGVRLTQAGWLPPAVVVEAMTDLGLDTDWIGKGNREDLTEPVRALRASAQRMGLLRVSKGTLLCTKAGSALAGDPVALWRHVAQRAAGKPRDPFARAATTLVLLAAAAGRPGSADAGAVLGAAGWRTSGDDIPIGWVVRRSAEHAVEVLEAVAAYGARGVDMTAHAPRQEALPTSGGRALARVALRVTR